MVKKGDLLEKNVDGRDYSDVYMCVCADEEVFVIGRAKFKKVFKSTENSCSVEYEVCGASYENLRAFENSEKSLAKNGFVILE